MPLWSPAGIRQIVSALRSCTYSQDGLITNHNADFLHDPLFAESYRMGKATGSWGDSDLEWRAYVACWAAEKGKRLEGDFVECGVNRGGLALTVMNYIGFNQLAGRKFYLLDTYEGFPEETRPLASRPVLDRYTDCYNAVLKTFSAYENAVVVKGSVPDTLHQVKSEKVCYLSIDMNCAEPEIAAATYFWDRLVSGAVILLDDYGYSKDYLRQKQAFDAFAKKRGVQVLLIPTGQGLVFKP